MQPADRQWEPCRRGVSLVGGAAKRTASQEKGRQGRRPAIAAGRLQQRQRNFFFFFPPLVYFSSRKKGRGKKKEDGWVMQEVVRNSTPSPKKRAELFEVEMFFT